MKKIWFFIREVLSAILCFADTACIVWISLVIRDKINNMLKIEEEISLHKLWERLRIAEGFWQVVVAAFVISMLLLLLILSSRDRRLAFKRIAGWLLVSASAVCCFIFLCFLLLALPAAFDGTVPLLTVLGDVVIILSFTGFSLFGFLACILMGHETAAGTASQSDG